MIDPKVLEMAKEWLKDGADRHDPTTVLARALVEREEPVKVTQDIFCEGRCLCGVDLTAGMKYCYGCGARLEWV
jgi:hypothetical protein